MALTRIDNPTPSAPAALADYVQILAVSNGAILQALRGNSHACIDFANNFARAGTVFYIAGVLYKAVTDQAISGTPSKYVKITPSGATAAIAYIASLSGVTWSDAQSGYYDGSSNLYVFDEARSVYDGVVSAPKTNEGQIAFISNDLQIKGTLSAVKASFSQTTGTQPFTVVSKTAVNNLQAQFLQIFFYEFATYSPDTIFDTLTALGISTNAWACIGWLKNNSSGDVIFIERVYKSTVNILTFVGMDFSTGVGTNFSMTNGTVTPNYQGTFLLFQNASP